MHSLQGAICHFLWGLNKIMLLTQYKVLFADQKTFVYHFIHYFDDMANAFILINVYRFD